MADKTKIFSFIITADIVLFLLCVLSFYLINKKAGLPFSVTEKDRALVVSAISYPYNAPGAGIKTGTKILSINGLKFDRREEAELFLDGKKIGEETKLDLSSNGDKFSEIITLEKYYKDSDIILYAVTGIVYFLIGIFVLYKCTGKKEARIFHWACICTAIVITMTPAHYSRDWYGIEYMIRFLFLFGYTLIPSLFVHFTYLFPNQYHRKYKLIYLFYSVSLLLGLLLGGLFYVSVKEQSVFWIDKYVSSFNIFRIFVIAGFLFAIINFIKRFKTAKSLPEKKKLKWILYGFVIGPGSYLILWVLPHLFFGEGFLPEGLVIILFTAVPITFTIAIVKYHLMNIDLIINRSVVYALVIAFLFLVYAIILILITNLLDLPFTDRYSSVTAIILVAILFQPVRTHVQKFVDKKFFRVQYDYRQAINEFFEEIKEINDIPTLAEKITERTDKLIPVKKIGFFLLLQDKRIKLISQKNFDLLIGRSVRFEAENLKTNLSIPIAVESKIEPGIKIEIADTRVFSRWGMCLVLPLKSAAGEIYGFIVLGEKKSDRKFTTEDVDLLNTVASRAVATLERIKLQEELIRKHLEAERLEELNKLKSFFVSRVSHDFKNPLTSIKMFTEILRNSEDLTDEKKKEYLKIIEGESDKLTLLINNVLDFSRIEKGAREYCFENVSLNDVVEDVLKTLQYQIKMQKFEIEVKLPEAKIEIPGDKVAVGEAIINLITNAMKYSREKKKIRVTAESGDGFASVEIQDNGIGINQEELKNIFEPFFRSKYEEAKKVSGTGLGLAIVKHVMDAHKGVIDVKSELNKGSSFTLKFPIS